MVNIAKKLFNFFSKVKFSEICDLIETLIFALEDGNLSKEELKDILDRAEKVLEQLING